MSTKENNHWRTDGNKCTCLWRSIFICFKAVFMHDPIWLLPIWCSSLVIHQSFSHSNQPKLGVYWLVSSSGFPESSRCCSISSSSSWILFIFVAKQVPLVLFFCSYPTYLCDIILLKLKLEFKSCNWVLFCVMIIYIHVPWRSQGSSLYRSTSFITSRSTFLPATFFLR